MLQTYYYNSTCIMGIIIFFTFLYLGIKVLKKYLQVNRIEFFGLSFFFIGISGAWVIGLNYFLNILFNFSLSDSVLLFISLSGGLIASMLLCIVSIYLTSYKSKKSIILLLAFITTIWESMYIFTFAFFPRFLGTFDPLQYNFGFLFILAMITLMILAILFTFIFIYPKLNKSVDKVTRLKGKLMVIGFFLFAICHTIDMAIKNENLTYIIFYARIGIAISAFLIYFSFAMPNFVKKRITGIKV